ncbi:MAG: hypothetical protein LBH26_01630 [Treponema sp.]|jgi:hypothetical protein|nr:hypothetical protein [Treponema sp.]
MTFSDRFKDMFEQGIAVSKDFAVKAGAKAQDLGERGMLALEIKQLEGQARKLISRLGAEAYRIFVENADKTMSADDPVIKSLLDELASVKGGIEKREQELSERRKAQ